ncbi:MAG: hypothetical protein QXY46_05940 [Candidatus Bathyarchaeia archaeon]
MPSRYEKAVYDMLSDEPVTSNEAAKKLGVNYHTAKNVLMHLAVTRKDVRYKSSGRIHIFWRESKRRV